MIIYLFIYQGGLPGCPVVQERFVWFISAGIWLSSGVSVSSSREIYCRFAGSSPDRFDARPSCFGSCSVTSPPPLKSHLVRLAAVMRSYPRSWNSSTRSSCSVSTPPSPRETTCIDRQPRSRPRNSRYIGYKKYLLDSPARSGLSSCSGSTPPPRTPWSCFGAACCLSLNTFSSPPPLLLVPVPESFYFNQVAPSTAS